MYFVFTITFYINVYQSWTRCFGDLYWTLFVASSTITRS